MKRSAGTAPLRLTLNQSRLSSVELLIGRQMVEFAEAVQLLLAGVLVPVAGQPCPLLVAEVFRKPKEV